MYHENTHKKHLLLTDEERKKLSDLQKNIGSKLRALREEKGYDINSVAKDIGISKGTLSKIEQGTYHYNIAIISRLAAYFGISDEILPPQHKAIKYICDKLKYFLRNQNFTVSI